jgi:hypothetical protein
MTAHYSFAMTTSVLNQGDRLDGLLTIWICDRLGEVGWTELATRTHESEDAETETAQALRVSTPMGDRARLSVSFGWRYRGASSSHRRTELFSREDYHRLMVTDLAVEVLVRNL